MLCFDNMTIRTIEEKDIDTIFLWSSNEFRGDYQESTFESKQSIIKQYHENGFCSEKFIILMVEDDTSPIGLIYINFIRQGLAGLGVVLCAKERGKGIGGKITSSIIEYIFSNYDICRIQADTDINNIPAQKVLEKAGFAKEGILRKYRYHHNKYNDSILYSIVR